MRMDLCKDWWRKLTLEVKWIVNNIIQRRDNSSLAGESGARDKWRDWKINKKNVHAHRYT